MTGTGKGATSGGGAQHIRSARDVAIRLRDKAWERIETPRWATTVGSDLDQFFTKPEVAAACVASLKSFLEAQRVDSEKLLYIEPSAGMGAFYNLLPPGQRLGVDVQAFNPEYEQADFLTWQPNTSLTKGRIVCVGNPPFGKRGWLALAFLNHAAEFADYVAFIVPMGFQSRGKGNLQDRVKGLTLVQSSPLSIDSFCDENGRTLKVNCLWQIWAKESLVPKKTVPSCSDFVELFTVDTRSERRCGEKRMHEAACFLQRSYYRTPPVPVRDFSDVTYGCGYGIVIKRDRRRVMAVLKKVDWNQYSNLASHNCRHISMCHIIQALTDNGIING